MALLTWAEYCAYVGQDPLVTDQQTLIEKIITSCEAQAARIVKRDIEEAEQVEIYDPSKTLVLPRFPITYDAMDVEPFTPVINLDIRYDPNRTFGDGTIIEPSKYYADTRRGIIRFYETLGDCALSLKVTWKGGWTSATLPADIMRALAESVLWNKRRLTSNQIGVRSLSGNDIQTNYEITMPLSAVTVLESYGDY